MIKLAEDNDMTEVPLDLTDSELLVLFKMAHEADITFNKFVEQVLVEYLERQTNDPLLNELDGSSDNEVVQRPWPYPG